MGIKDRITKLERHDESCVVCGWGPRTALHVEWEHDGPDEAEPEYCPACGRPDEIVVTWGDVDGD